MAVFPDRIVNKNSTDGDTSVKSQIAENGASPVVAGELVVSRGVGKASLLTLDSNGVPVTVGAPADVARVAPDILLNFEEDGTDTPFVPSTGSAFPSTNDAKFGSQSFEARNSSEATGGSLRFDLLEIESTNLPLIGQNAWTVQFWYKSSPSNWYDQSAINGSPVPRGYQMILSRRGYVFGAGTFNIYLDAGTIDQGGGLTTTSNTSNQAFGSVCFGLGPGFSNNSWPNGIPATGEVVTSGIVGVIDDNWHHVAVTHDGRGLYAIYIDGELTNSTQLDAALDQRDPDGSGVILPTDLNIGGNTATQTNGASGPIGGFNGYLDAFSFYNNVNLFEGLFAFPIPDSPPSPDLIDIPRNTLDRLEDVNLPPRSEIPNAAVLAFNTSTSFWEYRENPPVDLSSSELGDLGDVVLQADIQIPNDSTLTWNAANDRWEDKVISLGSLFDVSSNVAGDDQYLGWNGIQWAPRTIQYSQVSGAPNSLGDLINDLFETLGDIPDVELTDLQDNQVLVYDAPTLRWVNETAPPPDLSVSVLTDIGDVTYTEPVFPEYGYNKVQYLAWNSGTSGWENVAIRYIDIADRPTAITDLNRNVGVSYWPNDAGYVSSTQNNQTIEIFDDIDLTNPQNSQILVYRDGVFKNEFGPPADISANSIGDLGDVTYAGATILDPGTLTVENMGTLVIDHPLASSNLENHLKFDLEYGTAITSFRDFDQTGSAVYASRDRGVTLRSDVNYVRLTGRLGVETNRPELRFETGDSGGDNPYGNYISIKMPEVVEEDVIYLLPSADGDVGDILATDGSGALSWVAQDAASSLADLSDVDLDTIAPVEGSILVYNAAANLWVTGSLPAPTDISTIDNIGDVSTSGADAPNDKQSLVWNTNRQRWVPGDTAGTTKWAVSAVDSSAYQLAGPGLTGSENNPTIYVMRGQTYKFSKSITAHPFQIQEVPGTGQTAYSDGISGFYPLGLGEFEWEVRMDAPSTLYYQCTIHSAMVGTIHVLNESGNVVGSIDDLSDVDTSTNAPAEGNALLWNSSSSQWVPGVVSGGGGGTSSVIVSATAPTERPDGNALEDGDQWWQNTTGYLYIWYSSSWVQISTSGGGGGSGGSGAGMFLEEAQTAVGGLATYTGLGYSGILQKVTSDQAAWVVLYSSEAERTADSDRTFQEDPSPGSGVLFEAYVAAGDTVVASPGTTYMNSEDTPSEALYVAVRGVDGASVDAEVTFSAYGLAAITAVTGGSFGSGL